MAYNYNSSDPIKIGLDELTDREKHLLTESKTFCMYPWIHLHAYQTGDAYPCCQAEHLAGNFGNCQTTPMKEKIYLENAEGFKFEVSNSKIIDETLNLLETTLNKILSDTEQQVQDFVI